MESHSIERARDVDVRSYDRRRRGRYERVREH